MKREGRKCIMIEVLTQPVVNPGIFDTSLLTKPNW